MLQAGTGSLQGGTGDGVWASRKRGNGAQCDPSLPSGMGTEPFTPTTSIPFFPQPRRVHPTRATDCQCLVLRGPPKQA